MLKHLRAQNRAIEKGLRSLNTYLGHVSRDTALDENGKARLQFENVGVHVVAVPNANLVIFKAFINFLPDPASGKILPLYYHLLDENDAPSTGMAYFSIVAAEEIGTEHDVISVETKRPLVDMSFDEFMACLQVVGEVANLHIQKLAEAFDAPPIP